MNSKNEWDSLESVVVGIADHAKIPNLDKSLRTVNYADVDDVSNLPVGLYPKQIIDQANEDLEVFASFLKGEGIEVVRPDPTDCSYYNYCPRDSVLVHSDKSIATPMPLRSRKDEYEAYKQHLNNVIDLNRNHPDTLYNVNCVGNPDILALTETCPAFDAANVLRANDDLLYLVSNSGNKAGASLLQETLGNNVKVHTLENVYSYMHIDSTIAFLQEGLMLLNPERIKDVSVLPEPFNKWDYIWCPEPEPMNYYPGYCNASKWMHLNLLSVAPNLVVIEENQNKLRKELEKKGIDCAMLPGRQQRSLGGGFHCVTLDLKRRSI